MVNRALGTGEPTLTPVLASEGSTYLTPGVHRLALNPTSHVNQTTSRTSESTTVLPPPQPLAFPGPLFSGEPGVGEWESLYLPPGWYASVGGHALWGAIPDRGALVAGKYDIEGFGNGEYNSHQSERTMHPEAVLIPDLCSPPCSHGTCTSASDNNATCACAPGWAGAACDACAPNHFGPSCQRALPHLEPPPR
jgi:hypothetical protein